MTARPRLRRLVAADRLNFLMTNRIPRRLATRLMGRVSRIENRWFTAVGIAIWRLFCDLDLRDARITRFNSLQECFTRELNIGARPVDDDPSILSSPCDALVGARGDIGEGTVLQAKGHPYAIEDLVADRQLAEYYRGGSYATLRLTAGMYHRFHAPHDCRVERVDYISGDTWNVNPATLDRVERVFCRNERAVIRCRLRTGQLITLVPVAAILVASIRLRFVDVRLHLRYRGPNVIPCTADLTKGEEMGWFEHGSTIIVLAPAGISMPARIAAGAPIRAGRALMRIDA